jgi:alkyl hydroperoxide reductase subunit AhpC
MSMVGNEEPDWSGSAYVRDERKSLRAQDYVGKWHLIYWYPADFTWLCPTEIREFQAILPRFAADGIELIGASTDSFFSHSAKIAAASLNSFGNMEFRRFRR